MKSGGIRVLVNEKNAQLALLVLAAINSLAAYNKSKITFTAVYYH